MTNAPTIAQVQEYIEGYYQACEDANLVSCTTSASREGPSCVDCAATYDLEIGDNVGNTATRRFTDNWTVWLENIDGNLVVYGEY